MGGIDPERDLVLERVVGLTPAAVWRAWTEPALLMRWLTPAPWRTIECDIDLRPGGRFFTRMRGPDGQEFDNAGCYLEVVPERRLTWTSALAPGFRPAADGPLAFTAMITLEAAGDGTRYGARAMHGDAETCRRHAAMGFRDGWGKALDQLVDCMRGA